MKTAIKRICQIISLAAMMMFVMISMHVLLAGHDQGELDGKVENSQCSRKNKRGDVRMIAASISHEVKGDEQKVHVRPDENCPDSEVIAPEHQCVFQDEEGDSGEEYRLYLFPVNNDIEEQSDRCKGCDNVRDGHAVDIHRAIFLCLVCMFVMLTPVCLKNL